MNRNRSRSRTTALAAIVAILSLLSFSTATSQDVPPPKPIDLPCVTDATSQLLAATPVGDGSQTLVLVRVTIVPGGTIRDHTHPVTLAVVIEQGTFGLTLVDHGEMTVTRAATANTEATPESLVPGQESTLNPGDSFIEMGMVHSARNLGDVDTSALISGLIETGQPLTECVAQGGTPTM